MTTEQDRLHYATISQDEWESFPDPQVKPASRWEDALADLQAGKIIEMQYVDRRDKLSKRISIARQATARGFKTAMRYTDTTMAIRRVDGSPGPSPRLQGDASTTSPTTTGARRGRKRRTQQQQATTGDSSLNEGLQSDSSIEDLQEALD